MFEHILEQNAITQLVSDKAGGILAPSMLFAGPHASGKGTAGLELGRVLSCESPEAPLDCSCSGCMRHRLLTHPDMLCLGSRNFSSEISAALAGFLRAPGTIGFRTLFIRSVRKLLARFSPVLWEEEPKFSKLSDMVLSLEEALDEIWTESPSGTETLKKRCEGILKNALKLEAEGLSDLIPIGQIRRAAVWSHLVPMGKRKLLLIENADRMHEASRNSLLKILEEPPERLTILLTTSREKALLPTILSRVRPYRFVQRSNEAEAAVIRQVFGVNPSLSGGIPGYLDSFLPMPIERLRPLAGFFAAFIAMRAALTMKKRGISAIPEELIALGKHAAAVAEAGNLGRPGRDTQSVITKIVTDAEKFEVRGLFSQFLNLLLSLVFESARSLYQTGAQNPGINGYYDIWRTLVNDAAVGVGIYNQNPGLALERLSTELQQALNKREIQ
ncbi:MAG: DNA polymerase III [Treponema sp.]|jgi:DNA polymerase-3 subunit gamma/tau|nr:DNA polymerase III [Treponema sp.]